MLPPFGPYPSLSALLDAASVPVAEAHRYSTAELLERAAGRVDGDAPEPSPAVERWLSTAEHTSAIRSVRLSLSLLAVVERTAAARKLSRNRLINLAIVSYLKLEELPNG